MFMWLIPNSTQQLVLAYSPTLINPNDLKKISINSNGGIQLFKSAYLRFTKQRWPSVFEGSSGWFAGDDLQSPGTEGFSHFFSDHRCVVLLGKLCEQLLSLHLQVNKKGIRSDPHNILWSQERHKTVGIEVRLKSVPYVSELSQNKPNIFFPILEGPFKSKYKLISNESLPQ